MEHPLIGNLDNLSMDELNTQISELYRKLNIASRSGNGHLCNQLRMALESYSGKYQQRLQEEGQKNNFGDKIRIS